MDTVTGIFTSAGDAERAARGLESILSRDEIILLAPAATADPTEPSRSASIEPAEVMKAREFLPEGEIFIYEDALRQGRSILVACCGNISTTSSVRKLLEQEAAVTAGAAREMWWRGLRGGELEHYSLGAAKFDRDEKYYRLGFEAALHAKYRCKEYDQILSEMQADLADVQRRYAGVDVEEPFVRGFERGRDHYQALCKPSPK